MFFFEISLSKQKTHTKNKIGSFSRAFVFQIWWFFTSGQAAQLSLYTVYLCVRRRGERGREGGDEIRRRYEDNGRVRILFPNGNSGADCCFLPPCWSGSARAGGERIVEVFCKRNRHLKFRLIFPSIQNYPESAQKLSKTDVGIHD